MAVIDLSGAEFPMVKCTKDQYIELELKDSNKMYLITDAVEGDASIYIGDKVLANKTTSASYNDNLGSMIDLGGFTQGMTADNMTFQEFAYRLLHPTSPPPTVTFTSDLPKTIYEVGESITSVTLSTVVNRGLNDIISVQYYANGVLITEFTDVTDENTFSYEYTPDTPITSSVNLYTKVRCINAGSGVVEITKSIAVIFDTPSVIYSYYGTLPDEIYPATETDIKTFSKIVKTSREFSYVDPIVENGRICYAYPATFGELTSIKDGNGFNYNNSYTKFDVQVDGMDYYLYMLTDSTTLEEGDDFTQVFA